MADPAPRTIYDLGVALARIEGKVDNLIASEARNEDRHKDHEGRLTKLEKHLWLATGGLVALEALTWAIPLLKLLNPAK